MSIAAYLILARLQPMTTRLSKTRLLNHLQCPKRLYLEIHHRELAEISEDTKLAFQAGHTVGAIARSFYPDGILIEHDQELAKALQATQDVLKSQPDRPVFEATFNHDDVLVRADILKPAESGHHLIEVKSSASLKDYHLADCAVQTWVIENSGLRLGKVSLSHIDTSFVYPGENRYEGLLHDEDVTERARKLVTQVPTWVESARKTLSGDEPLIEPGEQCSSPYLCPFIAHCCPPPATEYPISLLPYGKKIISALRQEGYEDLREVPPERLTNPKHQRIHRITLNGVHELDPAAADIMAIHPFPRYYFDFETIQFTVPIWAGTRPYEMLPYQWSCHIEAANGELRHEEFLGLGDGAPMRPLAEKLIVVLNSAGPGPVFAYNKGFESGRLADLDERYPDLSDELASIRSRLVDPLPIARAHYYHPSMKGSWSLKAVLPAIAPHLDYAGLEHVQDGGMAGVVYLEILDPQTTLERRDVLISALRAYCARDTLGLVHLARFLSRRLDGK